MNWLFLTLLAICFRSIYGVMTKVLSNQVQTSVYTQASLLPFAAAIFSLIVSPVLGGIRLDWHQVNLSALLLLILGQGIGNVVYFKAIKFLTNGTAQIAFSSVLFFNTILSLLFLNLHLGLLNWLGLFILAMAIMMVITGKVTYNKYGVLLMVGSALSFSIFQLSSSVISAQVSSATYLLLSYLGSAVIVFVFYFKKIIDDIRKSESWQVLVKIPTLTALPSMVYFFFSYYAYRLAPEPPKVAMLLTGQVVVTILLSYWFLKEKTHLIRKVAAAILVVAASILIKV